MSELERRLLDAARSDHVPEALQLRMSEALASLPPVAASAAHGGALFSTVGIWGSLSLAVVAAIAGWQLRAAPAPPVSEAHARQPPAATAPIQPAAPALPSEPPPLVAASSLPRSAAPVVRPARGLSEELAVLDQARTALAASSLERASRLLDQHARDFPHKSLGPESDALRIQVLLAQGQHERASRLARRFLERYPTHPLAARVAEAR